MTTRFEMAQALVAKAEKRRSEIGDHGDPYEEALLTGIVPIELKIIVKEIFDHLRSALDYCAREICEECTLGSAVRIVYFPIVAKGFNPSNFKSRFGKLMPGVLNARPDLLIVLETFQPFATTDNDWLADFAFLCNENKHERLSVTECTSGYGLARKQDNGVIEVTTFKKDKTTPSPRITWARLHNSPLDGSGEYTFTYLSFSAIDKDVLCFLDQAIKGVKHIVRELESKF